MKKTTRYRLAGTSLGVLLLGGLVFLANLQEEKLQATLSDGTVVRIEKVEMSKIPSYDARNLQQRAGSWLYERKWGRSMLETLKINIPGGDGIFTHSESEQEVFQVWYSLSNPERGFFPEMTRNLGGRGSGGSSGSHLSRRGVELVDEDGCSYDEGWMYSSYMSFGTQTLLIQSFSFEHYNYTSEKQRLIVKFPGEKEPVTFVFKTPDPRKAPPVSSQAIPLPARLDMEDISIVLDSLQQKREKYWRRWDRRIHVERNFDFERNGPNRDEDYLIIDFTVSDSQGGGRGDVCARSREWIVKGFVRPQRLSAVNSSKRVLLENLSPPPPQEHRAVSLPAESREFLLSAYLVGPGTYVLDDNNIVSAGSVGDLEKQETIFSDIPRPRGSQNTSHSNSDSYWDKYMKKSFYWEQRIYNHAIPRLLLLTDRPALLFRAAPGNAKHSALLLSNAARQWEFCERDFSGNRWGAALLDWRKTSDPQIVEVGYAEAIPFELHILPTEEMRQSVLPPPVDKTKK